jgi:pSer/pThr/pTyr-binding forkhead associated (FHA) protein
MSGFVVLLLRLVIVLFLYAFLGWSLYTIWRDLRANALLSSAEHIPAITLSQAKEQRTKQFAQPELVLGRNPDCDYRVTDEMVSSRHTRLSYHHNQWWVEDLQSTNGTFLNEERVYTPTVLIEGDEIRCGRCSIAVSFSTKPDGSA